MRRLADIQLIGERWVHTARRLDDRRVFARVIVERVCEERIPDEVVLNVLQFPALCVEQDQRRIKPIAVTGRAEIEDPRLSLLGAEAKEVEIFFLVEAGVHRQRKRHGLRLVEAVVRLGLDDMRLIADAEDHQVRRATRRDHAEVVGAERRFGTDLEPQACTSEVALDHFASDRRVEKQDRLGTIEELAHHIDFEGGVSFPALWENVGDDGQVMLDLVRPRLPKYEAREARPPAPARLYTPSISSLKTMLPFPATGTPD